MERIYKLQEELENELQKALNEICKQTQTCSFWNNQRICILERREKHDEI